MHISTNIDGSDHQQKSKNTAKIRIKLTIKCTFKTVPFERVSRPRFFMQILCVKFKVKSNGSDCIKGIILDDISYWNKY